MQVQGVHEYEWCRPHLACTAFCISKLLRQRKDSAAWNATRCVGQRNHTCISYSPALIRHQPHPATDCGPTLGGLHRGTDLSLEGTTHRCTQGLHTLLWPRYTLGGGDGSALRIPAFRHLPFCLGVAWVFGVAPGIEAPYTYVWLRALLPQRRLKSQRPRQARSLCRIPKSTCRGIPASTCRNCWRREELMNLYIYICLYMHITQTKSRTSQ